MIFLGGRYSLSQETNFRSLKIFPELGDGSPGFNDNK